MKEYPNSAQDPNVTLQRKRFSNVHTARLGDAKATIQRKMILKVPEILA